MKKVPSLAQVPGREPGLPADPGGPPAAEEALTELAALGRALADPIRVRMLGMLAAGRHGCTLPELGVPAGDDPTQQGVCVCEFMACCGLGQSQASYHLARLKAAGLVREERRGRWSFYSLDRERAARLAGRLAAFLSPRKDPGAGG